MSTSLFFAAGYSVFEISKKHGAWTIKENTCEHGFRCLAVDQEAGRLYGGTFDHGLWFSDDHAKTWQPVGDGITHERVLSVAVSPTEKVGKYRVVWAGTEPSGLFRSEDGGHTWTDCPALLDLPSEPTWSFPPRPHTHHMRYIQPDLHEKNRIFAGIELGGVMKSEDNGKTWEDRKEGSQYDCHTLTMSKLAKDRIYEAAGGGFAESVDGGKTWQTINEGLGDYTYLVGIAVDPGDPDTMIASAAKNARTAYVPERASTVLVRREKGSEWKIVKNGLPRPKGSSVFSLLTDEDHPGKFFAVNNTGMYQSTDSGKNWRKIMLDWPMDVTKERIHSLVACKL